MSLVVALDAGPLGLVTNPKRSPESMACAQWLQTLVAAGARVVLVSLAFGVMFATFVTLLLVPIAYLILDDLQRLPRRLLALLGVVPK